MQFIHVLATQPTLSISALAVLGLLVGSFLNVVIHRLPRMLEREWRAECCEFLKQPNPEADAPAFNLVTPRSRCPGCGTMVAARDNIPLISWALLGGRCRQCRVPISLRYPLVEATAGILAGLVGWHFSQGPQADSALWLAQALLAAGFCWTLLALALIDLDTKYLPDTITLPLLWSGVIVAFFDVFGVTLEGSIIGAIAGYGTLRAIFEIYRKLTGKEGFGFGDFKLLAAMGTWMGWQSLFPIVMISSAVGSIVGLSMILLGRTRPEDHIPFGPYLAVAGLVMLFWREEILAFLSVGIRL